MKRRFVLATLFILLGAGHAAAQFVATAGVIPVVANNSGGNGTFWRSDVIITNTGEADTSVFLLLFPEIVNGEAVFETMQSDPVTVPAFGQVKISNVVQSEFQLFEKKGGLWVGQSGTMPLVISSRVYTVGDNQCEGSFGQNVNSALVAKKAWAGGLQHDASYRSNIGVFLPFEPAEGQSVSFTVDIYDDDGALAGSGQLTFDQAGLQQTSVETFDVTLLFNGYALITCDDPTMVWYAYASIVDQVSGDAVFRPGTGSQQDLPLAFR